MTADAIGSEGFFLQDLTPTPPDTAPPRVEESDDEEDSTPHRQRIQMVFTSAVLGGASVGAVGCLTGGVGALLLAGGSIPAIAGTAAQGALIGGWAGASVGGVRALFFDAPTREISVFYSALTGAMVGHTAALFPDGPFVGAWTVVGAAIGTVEGWAESELRKRLTQLSDPL
jgi:uncharacterized membrane protein